MTGYRISLEALDDFTISCFKCSSRIPKPLTRKFQTLCDIITITFMMNVSVYENVYLNNKIFAHVTLNILLKYNQDRMTLRGNFYLNFSYSSLKMDKMQASVLTVIFVFAWVFFPAKRNSMRVSTLLKTKYSVMSRPFSKLDKVCFNTAHTEFFLKKRSVDETKLT